jgi:putative nucleotidyltransferase with HDIG domain
VIASVTTGTTSERTQERVRLWLDRLPPMPALLNRLLTTMTADADEICLREVAELAAMDTLIAGRVLAVANSSFYSRGRTVCSVDEAVVRLGVQVVRNLLLTLSVNRFWGGLVVHDTFSMLRFNKHSLATAILSDLLARRFRVRQADAAFVAGLFHDVGQLVLASVFPDDYVRLSEQMLEGEDLEEQEYALFGFSHADLSAEATAQWNLPGVVQTAVRFHERTMNEERSEEDVELSR